MPLEKNSVIDEIQVVKNGRVQVRIRNDFLENGNVVSFDFHRYVVNPGDDYSAENDEVKRICETYHTVEIISAFQSSQEF